MVSPPTPRSYEEWKHCITELCRIPLTRDYVNARIIALADPNDFGTQRFVETWGAEHLDQIRHWFARAASELEAAPGTPMP